VEKKVAGISTPGIGSGLDVNGIVTKLMQVEAQPLANFDKNIASYQAKLTAFGTVSGALSSFQGSLSTLTSAASFQSVSATSNNTDILVGSATSAAVAGLYKINVSQVATAQTLSSGGVASTTTPIGVGTLNFQLGTVSGGNFGLAAASLPQASAAGGITAGSLTINGTAITTSAATKTAQLLADAINDKSATTGVTAVIAPTVADHLFGGNGISSYGAIDTTGGGTYALSINGIEIASQGAGVAANDGVNAGGIDDILAANNATTTALAAAGITFSGHAFDGSLAFTSADGTALTITEAVSGSVNGGFGRPETDPNTGSTQTINSGLTLSSASASPITIGGTNPARAGLVAGSGGSYIGASFAQDGNQLSGSVVIDAGNNSLQGIRDAINKAGIGVTATIVSDGSAAPNHLVLSSTKTGASSTIKIAVAGGDAALENLLNYDPAGTQNLTQKTAAQSTKLDVNGIAVTSDTTAVNGAIQGVNLTIGTTGAASLTIARDSGAIKSGVNAFVKAYNDLNNAVKNVSSYNADTKTGGPLLGDVTTQSIQAQVRKALSTPITGLSGNVTTLSQLGISFQKDGSLTLDSGKLGTAISNNFDDIGRLFAAIGKTSDSLVNFSASSDKTKPGSYGLNVTTLATQASFTSDAALAPTTTIAAGTTWAVKLNDTASSSTSHNATITVPAGDYTASALASLLQSSINAVPSFVTNGDTVSVDVDGNGKLVVQTSRYGSVTNISLAGLSGTALSDVFGAGTEVDGVDVAGTIGGTAVTGSGQFLTGATGSDADGLKVEITGGSTGDRGTISFSQGYAYQLSKLAGTFLGSAGFLQGRTDGLNRSIKDINKQKDDFSARLTDIEARYRAQYTALDTSIASLNSTSSFLTQQFAAISKQTG
jgi:flagellar hook-associated protein 2